MVSKNRKLGNAWVLEKRIYLHSVNCVFTNYEILEKKSQAEIIRKKKF